MCKCCKWTKYNKAITQWLNAPLPADRRENVFPRKEYKGEQGGMPGDHFVHLHIGKLAHSLSH